VTGDVTGTLATLLDSGAVTLGIDADDAERKTLALAGGTRVELEAAIVGDSAVGMDPARAGGGDPVAGARTLVAVAAAELDSPATGSFRTNNQKITTNNPTPRARAAERAVPRFTGGAGTLDATPLRVLAVMAVMAPASRPEPEELGGSDAVERSEMAEGSGPTELVRAGGTNESAGRNGDALLVGSGAGGARASPPPCEVDGSAAAAAGASSARSPSGTGVPTSPAFSPAPTGTCGAGSSSAARGGTSATSGVGSESAPSTAVVDPVSDA
jgi:hypothetical protein